jgi:8-oxo-dGTP pyrophosphatase MutT (NUDIX family)
MKAVGAEPNFQLVAPSQTVDQGVDPSVVTRDAATVILVSDRPDLHVLMMERTRRAVFGPGATVFPGGAVDPGDAHAGLAERILGMADEAASADQGIPRGGLAFRVAALRECFEEAGLLLARDAATGRPVDHDPALAAARRDLNAGVIAFGDLLVRRDLVFDARELRVFSHWLTPLGAPRRYNTWFFVAAAPEGEEGTHDDNELVSSEWVRPADALAQHADGRIDLIFPTEMSLRALSHYDNARDLLRDLDAVERDATGQPAVVNDGTGQRVALPQDSGRPTMSWTIPLPDILSRAERAAAAASATKKAR